MPRSLPQQAVPAAAAAGSVQLTLCEVPERPCGVARCQSLLLFEVSPTKPVVHGLGPSKSSYTKELNWPTKNSRGAQKALLVCAPESVATTVYSTRTGEVT